MGIKKRKVYNRGKTVSVYTLYNEGFKEGVFRGTVHCVPTFPAGFEPATASLTARCFYQLSYGNNNDTSRFKELN